MMERSTCNAPVRVRRDTGARAVVTGDAALMSCVLCGGAVGMPRGPDSAWVFPQRLSRGSHRYKDSGKDLDFPEPEGKSTGSDTEPAPVPPSRHAQHSRSALCMEGSWGPHCTPPPLFARPLPNKNCF